MGEDYGITRARWYNWVIGGYHCGGLMGTSYAGLSVLSTVSSRLYRVLQPSGSHTCSWLLAWLLLGL